jgi:hypothetical protein
VRQKKRTVWQERPIGIFIAWQRQGQEQQQEQLQQHEQQQEAERGQMLLGQFPIGFF